MALADSLPKIPSSAFVTVGEPAANMAAVEAGTAPKAEYAVLRRGHFSKVIAMVDQGLDPGSMAVGARFALNAYFDTWDHANVYLGEEFPGIQYLAVHAAFRRPKKIAMLVHNVASKRRSLPLATLGLAKQASHLLCLSERSKLELTRDYGFPSERITVVGSRVDSDFFCPRADAKVEAQVCSAGAINRDYETLIAAVTPLGVPLKIAADTAWRYSAGTQDVGPLPPFVEMRSWGSYVNLRQLYAESAVVVVPLARSILSGITVVLEAMAMGKPVILTRNDYVEDFVRDGENGYFVPAGDADALSGKIRHVLDHPDEAARVGNAARAWILERFTVSHYVNRLLGVWE
jgi:glycosyltransferase involved in cell wall biosynthesis